MISRGLVTSFWCYKPQRHPLRGFVGTNGIPPVWWHLKGDIISPSNLSVWLCDINKELVWRECISPPMCNMLLIVPRIHSDSTLERSMKWIRCLDLSTKDIDPTLRWWFVCCVGSCLGQLSSQYVIKIWSRQVEKSYWCLTPFQSKAII